MCTICNPVNNSSSKEIELKNFIKNNYLGEIIENTRNIINPYEIDIFLPELNIGFEFNGLYWHSDKYKSTDYHKIKQKIALQNDIKLYNIYEDEWAYKRNIVESNILKLLNKTNIININEIKKDKFSKDVELFLNENSIYIDYNEISIFLYLYDEIKNLIGLISFFNNSDDIEIIGIYEKNNIRIDMINIIKKYFNNNNIFITVNSDWDNLNLQNRICEINPNFYYIINDKRTNIEIEHKYKIYDAGKIIYKL